MRKTNLMGLLTVSKRLENDHPEIIVMAIKWLVKECNAQILKVNKGENTQYHIEGEEIPKGDKKFDVILKKIVPRVFSISIK